MTIPACLAIGAVSTLFILALAGSVGVIVGSVWPARHKIWWALFPANPASQDRRSRRFAIKPASGLDQRLPSTFGARG